MRSSHDHACDLDSPINRNFPASPFRPTAISEKCALSKPFYVWSGGEDDLSRADTVNPLMTVTRKQRRGRLAGSYASAALKADAMHRHQDEQRVNNEHTSEREAAGRCGAVAETCSSWSRAWKIAG